VETGFVGQTPGYIQAMGDYGARGYYRPSFWRRHRKAIIIVFVLLLLLGGVGVFLGFAFAKGWFKVDAKEMNEWLGDVTEGIIGEGAEREVEGAKLDGPVDLGEMIGDGLRGFHNAVENITVGLPKEGAGQELPVVADANTDGATDAHELMRDAIHRLTGTIKNTAEHFADLDEGYPTAEGAKTKGAVDVHEMASKAE
jgi:hypothetical protein